MKTLEMKTFEGNLTHNKWSKVQLKGRRDLNYIYDQKFQDMKVRRKCNLYEDFQKIFKFFLNLENNGTSQINTFAKNRWKGRKRSKQNTAKIGSVYEVLFSKKIFNSDEVIAHHLNDWSFNEVSILEHVSRFQIWHFNEGFFRSSMLNCFKPGLLQI